MRIMIDPKTPQARRDFLKAGALIAVFPAILSAQSTKAIKVGLVGCGGRGTGAASQALNADDYSELTAMADVYQERIDESLDTLRKVTEEGVLFRSHLNGDQHLFTPESTIDVQMSLGSDIMMVLDECLAYPATHEDAAESMQRSVRWAARCRARLELLRRTPADVTVSNPGQAQFGIVQGGVFSDLRQESADATVAIGFEGYAIGGLSVGEPIDQMYQVVQETTARLPRALPRYLMGAGTPEDLVECVARGIDMFDCVLPTRNARNGQLFTSVGRLNIKNAKYAEDEGPVDPACRCYTCTHHTRAYLRHLYQAGEMSAGALNTLHNLTFYLDTMKRIREAIQLGTFERFRQEFLRSVSSLSLDS